MTTLPSRDVYCLVKQTKVHEKKSHPKKEVILLISYYQVTLEETVTIFYEQASNKNVIIQ